MGLPEPYIALNPAKWGHIPRVPLRDDFPGEWSGVSMQSPIKAISMIVAKFPDNREKYRESQGVFCSNKIINPPLMPIISAFFKASHITI
jgi:hypothetical protein